MKTILMTGATGLIGTHIYEALKARGDNAFIVSTNPKRAEAVLKDAKGYVKIDELDSISEESIDAVINLAGKNLGESRWNDKIKKEMRDSRIVTTRKVVEFISSMKNKPEVLVSASGVDYYGNRGDEEVFEDSPPGNGFAARLTVDWEAEAMKAENAGIRTVALRTGFVIAENNDGLQKMALPFRFYIGGHIGSGEQYLSWIHIDDIRDIYLFTVDNKNLRGPVNACSPKPEKMKDVAKAIGKVLKKPSYIKTPDFAVKLVAGESSELVLTGRKAIPKKLMENGYEFRYVNIYDALRKELK